MDQLETKETHKPSSVYLGIVSHANMNPIVASLDEIQVGEWYQLTQSYETRRDETWLIRVSSILSVSMKYDEFFYLAHDEKRIRRTVLSDTIVFDYENRTYRKADSFQLKMIKNLNFSEFFGI